MSLKVLLAGLPIPILQAPMAGASSLEMALAVSRAGGLGSLAAAGLSPDDIEVNVRRLRGESLGPFGVNLLMAPPATPDHETLEDALAILRPWYDELGADLPAVPNRFSQDFESQLAAVVRAAPPIASFAFGVLRPEQIRALQSAGSFVVGTANTVAEAKTWVEAGADGICAQGFEAGGHRGNFLDEIDASLVGTLALVATVLQSVEVPVIAAGGIMDGRGVAAVLALGADAAQMGSAFLRSEQAVTGATWQAAIEAAPDDPTRLTRAFSGRYARGIENRFMREMRASETTAPAYPVQNRLTQPLRAAAEAAGNPEMMSLWAGQAVKLAQPGEAGELVEAWWRQAREAAGDLSRRTGANQGRAR